MSLLDDHNRRMEQQHEKVKMEFGSTTEAQTYSRQHKFSSLPREFLQQKANLTSIVLPEGCCLCGSKYGLLFPIFHTLVIDILKHAQNLDIQDFVIVKMPGNTVIDFSFDVMPDVAYAAKNDINIDLHGPSYPMCMVVYRA